MGLGGQKSHLFEATQGNVTFERFFSLGEYLRVISESCPPSVELRFTFLMHDPSEQVVEAVVDALKEKQDPEEFRRFDMRHKATVTLFETVDCRGAVGLKRWRGMGHSRRYFQGDGAALARQRASKLLEKSAGKKFGYDADKDFKRNEAAVASINTWLKIKVRHSRGTKKARHFARNNYGGIIARHLVA